MQGMCIICYSVSFRIYLLIHQSRRAERHTYSIDDETNTKICERKQDKGNDNGDDYEGCGIRQNENKLHPIKVKIGMPNH